MSKQSHSSKSSPKMVDSTRFFRNVTNDYSKTTKFVIKKDKIVESINHHVQNILRQMPPSLENVDGGLYVGTAGIAFMFYYLSESPNFESERKQFYLQKSLMYLNPALEIASRGSNRDKTSFILGDAGTYALATALFKKLRDPRYTENLELYQSLYRSYLDPKFLQCGSDELFVGRAGYLAGILWLRKEINELIVSNEDLYTICNVIVANGKSLASKTCTECPLMYSYYGTQYLGAAHGLSSILQMLISIPGYLEHNISAAEDIKASVRYMKTIQSREGNWAACMEEISVPKHKLVHWCHGAPGVIYLMAKAYNVYGKKKYLDSCILAADLIWEKGLLKKGPGICHGVAGNAYAFLIMYRLTNDEKYLYRAYVFAKFMNTEKFQKAHTPDNPESLFEGVAGTVCFLSDLLSPQQAKFPFFDIFH